MDFTYFTTSENDEGRRLDRILKRILPETSSPIIFKSLRKGLIKLNDKKAEGSTHVLNGDTIKIASFLLSAADLKNNSSNNSESNKSKSTKESCTDIETVFKNEYVWIINKPYGIPVQPSESSKTSVAEIISAKSSASEKDSLSFRTGPLHRLDRFTTGLLAFSQNLTGAQWFSKAISGGTEYTDDKKIRKIYIGIIQGRLDSSKTWENGIEDSNEMNSSFHSVKVVDKSEGQLAVTKAYPLAYGKYNGKDVTLAQFNILTGRKHQIRAQSAHNGFPLLGDDIYGGENISNKSNSYRKFYLHAIRMCFPKDNPLKLSEHLDAPLQSDFKLFLDSILINWDGGLIL